MSHLPWSWIWKVWSLSNKFSEKGRFEKWSLKGSQSHLFASYCTRKTSLFHIQSFFPALHLPFSMLTIETQCSAYQPVLTLDLRLRHISCNESWPISEFQFLLDWEWFCVISCWNQRLHRFLSVMPFIYHSSDQTFLTRSSVYQNCFLSILQNVYL